MIHENFGEFLKSLRQEKGWTQEEICYDICDRRNYVRWEKNLSVPSFYHLNLLSRRLNYDLIPFYKFYTCNQSVTIYEYIKNAENYILNNDWTSLNNLIQKMITLKDFHTGENKENLCYYEALYYYECKMDYYMSISKCIDGLKEEYLSVTLTNPYDNVTTNIGLCLLNCLACNYNKINDSEKANEIFHNIINSIDNKIIPEISYYQSTEFEKKLYQTVIHNLSLNYKRKNKYEIALAYADKGIAFSLSHNFLYHLADILELKFDILYCLGEYKLAVQAYQLCLNTYLLQNKMSEYNKCIENVNSEFTKLKELL